jgi:hypothetical protein
MKPLLTLFGIVGILSLCPQRMFRIAGDNETSEPRSESSDPEARKMLSGSAWANRTKLRSTMKAATYNQPIENPGNTVGGLGPGGPGHGAVIPSAADVINLSAGPQVMPGRGWGIDRDSTAYAFKTEIHAWLMGRSQILSEFRETHERLKCANNSLAPRSSTTAEMVYALILWLTTFTKSHFKSTARRLRLAT